MAWHHDDNAFLSKRAIARTRLIHPLTPRPSRIVSLVPYNRPQLARQRNRVQFKELFDNRLGGFFHLGVSAEEDRAPFI